ncbi:MAG: FadD3 family acyl-CoA ligase [Actinomycetota bacterium]|nr:FadD3 family acyl-CoA ligase [Actinomycetota bacterium]
MSWLTIPELVEDAAERFGNREAVVDGSQRWTFTEYRDRIHAASRALISRGIGPGDRVAIWAPNAGEWALAALGVHCSGATLVPINTRFKGHEAGYILDRTSACLLFTVTDFLDTNYVELLEDADQGASLKETVILRGMVPDGCTAWDAFMASAAKVDDADRAVRSTAVAPTDLCHIMFTSGTTGAPKGAMLQHGAVCRSYKAWCEVIGLGDTDRYLVINPFFHTFGLNAGILACLMTGATLIPHPVFDVPSVMKRIPQERITMLPGPPAIYQTILNHPDLQDFDMSSLRLAVTGAAAIPVEMIHGMRDRLGFETVVTGYGLTEASGIATMCRHDDDPELIANTSGRAIDGVEVLVVEDGKEVERGVPGEIVIRGYNVMVGYLDEPTLTAEVVDAEGWLHTGDIGVMNVDGYLDITDRVKDMFITGGFNVYPAEVENLLLDHPAIGQVAVVGIPDPRMGEVGVAFVVPALDIAPDEEEIVAWARERMANFKVPRRISVVESLPMNASGKVLKYELRNQAITSG